jgi:integrase
VLETAVEYGLLGSNPAAGKRRRLKATKPARPWVEPEQLPALLDAAPPGVGRTLLSVLAGTGLRISEALALRWRHVDLMGAGTLSIVASKTDAGVRSVDLTAALREEIRRWWRDTSFDRPDVDGEPAEPLEPAARRASASGRAGERGTRKGRNHTHRPDHLPQPEKDVREPSLRGRRRKTTLRTRPISSAIPTPGSASALHAGDEAAGAALGTALRAHDRAIEWAQMGTNHELERVLATAQATENPA